MSVLANTRIAARLAFAFGLMVLLMLGASLVGWMGMERQAHATADALHNDFALKYAVDGVHEHTLLLRRWEKDVFINIQQAEKVAAYKKSWDDELAKARRELATAERLGTDADREKTKRFSNEIGQYETGFGLVATKIQQGEIKSTADANAAMEKYKSSIHALEKAVDELSEVVLARANGVEARLLHEKNTALGWLAAMAVIAVVLGVAISYAICVSITRPLRRAVTVAERVAAGDLTEVFEVKGTDETAQLLCALKDMNESLGKIVGEVRASTDTITTASSEIAAGNQDLSQRTEEQASSLEETASSMEELTSTVRQNADNARQANQLAASASEIAVKGGAVVGDVVSTMGAISDSSKKIADIIGVIDGIAFQTNILALNAAVEAARAGEQGRGFAVVAGEVRNLAQRSAAAAKEIKALIEDSVGKVDGGAKLVDQAGQTMEEVVSSIKRVTDIMAEITAASQEQSSGIEQVNQAVTQMDQVTQQNAALVEEAAAAAESMQQQAQTLAQAVAVFKLGAQAKITQAPKPAVGKARAVERRGPNRAKNVTRVPAASAKPAPASAKTGTDDE